MASIKESLRAKGRVGIVLTDKNGQIKETRNIDNLVVTDGLEHIARRLEGTSTEVMTHMGIGNNIDGTTPTPAAGNEALANQLESRKAVTKSVSGATVTYNATFSEGESEGAITEAGIFSAASGGVMLCRVGFPVVNKGAADSMTISWEVSLVSSP